MLYVVVIVLCTILVCGYVGYPFVLQGILFLYMYCIIESLLNFVSTARNVLISVDVCILVVFTKQVSTVHTTLQNQGHCTKILLQLY